MVTGRPPFSGESPVAIAYKHVQEQPAPPRHLNTNVPSDLEAVILKLLSKNPQARYPSAEDLRADLRRFREGQPVLAVAGAAAGGAAAAGATQAMAATQAVRGVEGTTAVPVSEYAAGYAEPRRSGAFLVVLVLLLLILGGLLFALAKVISGGGSGGETIDITVPQGGVVGKPETEATKTLQTAGFDVTAVQEKNDTVPEGIVVSVDPAEGTTVKVDKGARGKATLHVSAGADTVKMPKVVGQLKDEAEKFLKDQGFTSITFDEGTSDDPNVQVNEVISQDPGEGQDVKKDAVIKLTISTGKPKVAVPDVAGKSVAEAASVLGQAGLDGSKTVTEASETVPKDEVIRTDPPAGTQVDKGSKVTIVVSSGKPQVSVPSVTGLTKAAADNAITNAGLVPQATCHVSASAPAGGEVTSQNPAKDTKVDKGSTVKYDYDAPVCS
jgi:serine/threonine-protein kinase